MKAYRIQPPTAPYIHRDGSVSAMMLDVCIALLPALLWGVYAFGLRALVILALSVIFCLGFEALWQVLRKKAFTLSNLSALVSALLLTMLLPVTVPLWMVPLGALIAMIAVKAAFGGLGKNPVNPAVTAKAFLFALFPLHLTRFTLPFRYLSPWKIEFLDVTLKPHLAPSTLDSLKDQGESLSNLFTGSTPGCIGEGSAMLLLAGILYLLVRKTVTWHVPVSFLVTVAAGSFLIPKEGGAFEFMLRYLMSGSVILAAGFLATDPVTSPVTRHGKLCYGFLCGAFTVLMRHFTGGEGAIVAILLANLSVWFLDRVFRPRPFGTRRFRKRPDVIPLPWNRAKPLFSAAGKTLQALFQKLKAVRLQLKKPKQENPVQESSEQNEETP